ncbi:hypothetical protein NC653_033068 [Populus alba x Populus x berolinensis]|uniref:Uncharacterized protein n=1 Tax=Populus alba x Populus x berolinensis TaxID=444605 RepID=A0AAD6Q0G4_9ROSI|nr:hypothetical protein NC653_033068 [Populus alba x Populus x berolinensis]
MLLSSEVDQEMQVQSIFTGNGLGLQYPHPIQQQIHMEQGLSLENTPFTIELTFQFDADDMKIPPKSLSRVNPEGIGDNDIEVDHLEAQNARKHFNSKDFPQKETLVTESDHDDTEVMEASSVVAQNQRAISPPLNQSTKKFLIM